MKKILALVVAFVLCFTAVAGCFTATAEDAVPTITIKDATAADGAIVIPVEGTNLQSVDSYLITVVLPADYTDIAVEGMTKLGDNGGDYVVNGTTVKMLNEIEKIDTDNDGAIAFNVTAKVPAVEADRVDDVTATVDAGNADAQPVDVTVVPGKATLKAPVVEPAEPVLDSNIVFTASGYVSDQLGVTYLFTNAQLAGYSNYELVVTATKYDGTYNEYVAEPVVIEKSDFLAANADYSYAVYSGIGMYEMALDISAYLKLYDAEGNYVAYSNTVTDDPATMLKATYKTSKNATFKTAVADMLIMGGSAQRYFASQKIASGSDLAKVTTYVDADDPAYNFVASDCASTTVGTLNTVDNTDWVENPVVAPTFSKSVSLTGAPAVLYMFDGTGLDKSKLVMEVSYTTKYVLVEGQNMEITDTVSGDAWLTAGNYYYYNFTKTCLYDSNKDVTAKVYYDGELILTDTYSVDTFVGANQTHSTMGELSTALCKFGISIRNYFVGS